MLKWWYLRNSTARGDNLGRALMGLASILQNPLSSSIIIYHLFRDFTVSFLLTWAPRHGFRVNSLRLLRTSWVLRQLTRSLPQRIVVLAFLWPSHRHHKSYAKASPLLRSVEIGVAWELDGTSVRPRRLCSYIICRYCMIFNIL